ncbi:MAG: dihydrolipoyl dehydrogenase [Bacteroidetes bacterium]|mgnify:CR=1 FL=1|jgi:dihydrolipoamide dehydrogenase|nr:dihydrolipoyl dehydrogenase [Bacteroidota bacterium]MBT6688041.1 dihydrolipoyl dehydrogenase [Bacteroidota bacterium]MBT7145171.1 dihydrolipoyl dehydrogenase [Bacteroidota bacterium]MBT7490909.1 dihydrolipoyl dehydrogenase [Bacteroidota bacterium]
MKYDIIIIGSGPAGYVAAIRAGQLGLKTAIVEKSEIGGMCLNWGCIPSKSIIESAKLYNKIIKDAAKFGVDGIDKKSISFNFAKATKRANQIVKRLTKGIEFLLKKNGVEIIQGEAEIVSKNSITVNNRNIETENIIISSGSYIPEIETTKNDLVLNVKELFTKSEIPENVVVYGRNSTAIELAQFFSLIRKNVTLVTDNGIILPLADKYLSKYIQTNLTKSKVKIIFNSPIENVENYFSEGILEINNEKVKCDIIINSQERKAVIPESKVKLEIENEFIKVDKNCKTNIDGIFAIGDVNGKSKFAHIASAQGLHVINLIKGVKSELDIKKYPLNMYTVPELSQIGQTEDDLIKSNVDYKISEFPLSANGKALAEGNNEGFIRILSEKKYGEVLGVQIVAANATDLIAEASAFMQLESTIYDVAKTVHAHPTISEIFMEVGFEAIDQAIHK